MTELDFWWPHPNAFNDLEVTDTEEGWQLSAPDDTELADWINYWDQDDEHRELFQKEFLKALFSHVEKLEDTNGETQNLSDEQGPDREQT